MLGKTRWVATCVSICLAVAQCALADDWRNWRGPYQDGHTVADGYFGEGSLELKLAWQQEMGAGYSGLAVLRGRLLVPFADGVDDWIAALGAESGQPLWKHRIGRMYPAHDGGHDGPLSTPVADDNSVYFLGPRGTLFGLLATRDDQSDVVGVEFVHAKQCGFCGDFP